MEVRCMPGLGNGECAEMKRARGLMVPVERAVRCDCDGRLPALRDGPVPVVAGLGLGKADVYRSRRAAKAFVGMK